MAKCIECIYFPWQPGADLDHLPAVRCHPELSARRFYGEVAYVERECSYFEAEEPVERKAPQTEMTVEELKEVVAALDDPEKVKALLDTEQSREKPRKSALEVLEERLLALNKGQANN